MDYKLFWSAESLKNLKDIINYLESEWSEKEVIRFKLKLSNHLDLIIRNPKIFPVSEFQPRLRKAVLIKQTTIYYEIREYEIHIAYLFNNRMDINKVK